MDVEVKEVEYAITIYLNVVFMGIDVISGFMWNAGKGEDMITEVNGSNVKVKFVAKVSLKRFSRGVSIVFNRGIDNFISDLKGESFNLLNFLR